MLLTSSDNTVIKQITFYFCLSTCFFFTTLLIVYFRTEYFLLAGKNQIIPLLIFCVIFEVGKWIVHRYLFEKDLRTTSIKKRILPGCKLFLKCLDFVHILKTFLATIIGIMLFFIICFLFGIQILEKYHQTLLFSCLMSILTVFPMCINFGLLSIIHFLLGYKPNNMLHWLVYTNVKMTLFGAWIGCFVMPLDWDRPWQVWPIPSALGALCGYTASHYFVYTQYFIFPSFFNKMK